MPVSNQPIDAVITWVDGQDEAHQQKLAAYLKTLGIERPRGAAPTRFNQCGEIGFCVRSILQFAPWVRTIYVVTDEQNPAIVNELTNTTAAEKIKLIDHRVIFEGLEENLPTFNSLSIETLLWRIEGLADRFIYFNDDCCLIRPVVETDFFREDRLVLRGRLRQQTHWKWRHRLKRHWMRLTHQAWDAPTPDIHRFIQENSARAVGFDKEYFDLPHTPFPLKRTLFSDYFTKHPDTLRDNSAYPLRDRNQLWPISLAYHLALKNQKAIIDEVRREVSFHATRHSERRIKRKLAFATLNARIKFLCMQSLDLAPNPVYRYVVDWLEKRFGTP